MLLSASGPAPLFHDAGHQGRGVCVGGAFLEAIPIPGQPAVTSLYMEVSGNRRNVSRRTQTEYIPNCTSSAFKIAESFLMACSMKCGVGEDGLEWKEIAMTTIKLCQSQAGEGKKF